MKKPLFVGSALVVLIFAVMVVGFTQVRAANVPVSGYAWSSNIGWIQFATGVSNPVVIDNVTGNWSGYAWSSNIGWLSFNSADTAYCRTTHGGPVANTNFLTGATVGWARFLAAVGREAEGWSGCLALSGPTHAVTYNPVSGSFSGFAWGGPVVGWTQFDTTVPVSITPVSFVAPVISGNCTAITASQNIPPGKNVTFQANPTSGTAPYGYSWSGGATTTNATFTLSYSANGPGPTVRIGDSSLPVNGYSSLINCPNVTVIPLVSNSDMAIGRTVASAVSQLAVINAGDPFAITWDVTQNDSYTVSVTVRDSEGNLVSNPGFNGWNNTVVNNSATNNGDGSITWDGDTGSTLSAGMVGSPLSPGTYSFTMNFTGQPSQSATVTLRVVETTETEI